MLRGLLAKQHRYVRFMDGKLWQILILIQDRKTQQFENERNHDIHQKMKISEL